jgi:hypothetical protein
MMRPMTVTDGTRHTSTKIGSWELNSPTSGVPTVLVEVANFADLFCLRPSRAALHIIFVLMSYLCPQLEHAPRRRRPVQVR